MKFVVATGLVGAVMSVVLVGCADTSKTSSKQETKISTPGGTTTITTEKEVKQPSTAP